MPGHWKSHEDALLYRFDDETVAKITGRTVNSVIARRKRLDGTYILKSHYCFQCGKEFFPPMPEKWAYRRQEKRLREFCSWHCMRDYDNGKPREKKIT